MNGFGPYAVAIAFWIFVAIAAVAGIVSDYQKRRLALEPLRLAIERGQQLDPAVIEKLTAGEQHKQELEPEYLQIGGIITIAAGVGLALFSFFIAQVRPQALYPVMGVGVIAICVGAGLLIAAKKMTQNRAIRQAHNLRG